ncbi:MAG: lysylphosphatidylglycerol synthase transmembrane domain-containing protein [Candidatus Hodarchaeota archaeon]
MAIFLIVWLIWFVGFSDVIKAVKEADLRYVIIAVFLSVLSLIVKGVRFHYLLKFRHNCSFNYFMPVFLFGYALSIAFPLKSGEIARIELKRRILGANAGNVTAALIVFRVFDVIAIFFLTSLAFFFVIPRYTEGVLLMIWYWAALLVVLCLLIVAVVVTFWEKAGRMFLGRILSFMMKFGKVGKRLSLFIMEELDHYYLSVKRYKELKTPLFITLILTGVRWGLEILMLQVIFIALGEEISFITAAFVIGVSIFVGIMTALPGGIGTGTISGALVLITMGGVKEVTATAGMLLAAVFGPILAVLAGIAGLGIMRAKKYEMKTTQNNNNREKEEEGKGGK